MEPSPIEPVTLLGDIGATNARFALQDAQGRLTSMRSMPGAEFPGPYQAMQAYLAGTSARVRAACLGVAAPVRGTTVRMTNRDWEFDSEALRRRMGLERLLVVNDFVALAHALPLLGPSDLLAVGGGRQDRAAPRAVLGPGTGLGAAALVPAGNATWLALAGEGGHVSFSPTTEPEIELWRHVRMRHEHVSAERLVCGRGLERIVEWLELSRDVPPRRLPAHRITELALHDADALCKEAVDMFCAILGTLAGNLALTIGARGGVYIGGGIVPRLGEFFVRSGFRRRFESKGRMGALLADIPVYVIRDPWAGLVGAGELMRQVQRTEPDA